jgi:EAL and modified HD-GYP domain-containing signal transduction protein
MRQWASLLVLAQMGNKPSELMRVALIRARMCEAICSQHGVSPSQGFTVGLFSILDAYFDCEMRDLLANLPLASEILDALLRKEGALGTILEGVLSYERGEWKQLDIIRAVEPDMLQTVYWEGIEWANGVMAAVVRKN